MSILILLLYFTFRPKSELVWCGILHQETGAQSGERLIKEAERNMIKAKAN